MTSIKTSFTKYRSDRLEQTKHCPIRILQVVFALDLGGISNYLMNVLRRLDHRRFQVDVLTHTLEDSYQPYLREIQSLGGQIIVCPDPRTCLLQPWRYARRFKQALHQYGSYDIIHTHTPPLDGAILYLARQVKVNSRIVYSHNADVVPKSGLRWYRQALRYAYYNLSQAWIAQYATIGLACSRPAAHFMFGANWRQDPRWQILHCGIDFTPFEQVKDMISVRREFGIPDDALVVGHVGRFAEQKNHRFLVEIAAEVVKQHPNTYFLLVGDGSLRPEIEQQVAKLDLVEQVIFAGTRADVPRLMQSMDVFVLPSLYEGLGLVAVEAQAAGLPCAIADGIPQEADVVEALIHRLPLALSAHTWANVILDVWNSKANPVQEYALSIVKASSFNIDNSIEQLIEIYESHC